MASGMRREPGPEGGGLGPGDDGVGRRGTAGIVGPRASRRKTGLMAGRLPGRRRPGRRRSGRPPPARPDARASAADARSSTRATRPVASSRSPSSPGPSWPKARTHRPVHDRRDGGLPGAGTTSGVTGPGSTVTQAVPSGTSPIPTRVSGSRSSWALPKRSIQVTVAATSAPAATVPDGGPPRARIRATDQAAGVDRGADQTGVAPDDQMGGGRGEDIAAVEGAGRSAGAQAGRVQHHGRPHPAQRRGQRAEQPVVRTHQPGRSARRHLEGHGPAIGAHPGVDHGHHHPGAEVGPGPHQQGRAGGHVEGGDLVGQVDHRDGRRQRVEDGVDHADELVGRAVVGEEEHRRLGPAGRR